MQSNDLLEGLILCQLTAYSGADRPHAACWGGGGCGGGQTAKRESKAFSYLLVGCLASNGPPHWIYVRSSVRSMPAILLMLVWAVAGVGALSALLRFPPTHSRTDSAQPNLCPDLPTTIPWTVYTVNLLTPSGSQGTAEICHHKPWIGLGWSFPFNFFFYFWVVWVRPEAFILLWQWMNWIFVWRFMTLSQRVHGNIWINPGFFLRMHLGVAHCQTTTTLYFSSDEKDFSSKCVGHMEWFWRAFQFYKFISHLLRYHSCGD